jgi:superfamily II DNA or RNA helicase
VERLLSRYDAPTHKVIPVGYFVQNDILYLPRGFNTTILEREFHTTPTLVNKCDEYCKIKKGVPKFEPKSIIQENAIKFLCSEDDYKYTHRYSQFGLNLDTGDGKTYAAITSILKLKIRTIIITHQDTIKSQWIDTLENMTTFPIENAVNITGADVMEKIMKGKVSGEIYFVNHQTINSYAKVHGWNAIRDFFKKIKVGIKVIDESHKFFENTLMIDAFSNTFKTFYLTATFGRSDPSEAAIYKKAYNSMVRFGEETLNYEEKRKHINFVVVYFNSKPEYGVLPNISTGYGFSAYKYIDYELKHEPNGSLMKVVKHILDQTSHMEGKTLIISPKKESVDYIADMVRDYTGKEVGTIYSNNSATVNQQNKQKEIISSTIKSLGEGADIKGLRILIDLEPVASKTLADQVRGRLREYSDTDDTYLFYPVDMALPESYSLLKRITPVMKKKCKQIIYMKMNV